MRENLLVCYGDGSSQPNPGFAGYGIFGYVLKATERAKNINYPLKGNVKFTSRGIINKNNCFNHTEPVTGGGVLNMNLSEEAFECTEIVEMIGSMDTDKGTNNQAEILAIINILKIALEREDINSVLVISDSEYALAGASKRAKTWNRTGWKTSQGKDVSNKDLWVEYLEVRKQIDDLKIKVDFRWVKGHAGEEGNVLADMFAVVGTNHARAYVKEHGSFVGLDLVPYRVTTTMTEFKKDLAKLHHIYDYRSMMFYSKQDDVRDEIAILVSAKEDDGLGKRNLETTYTVMLGDIPKEVREVRRAFQDLERTQENMCRVNLDIVKSDKMLMRLLNHIGYKSIVTPVSQRLKTPKLLLANKTDVLVEEYNRSFAFLTEATDTVNFLELAISNFGDNLAAGKIFDITDLFIDKEAKNPLKLNFRDRNFDLTDRIQLEGKTLVSKPIIYIGKDTPPYATFKEIAPQIEKVYIYPGAESYGNCATFVLFVQYKDESGKVCWLAHTNLLGKYLFKYDNQPEVVDE